MAEIEGGGGNLLTTKWGPMPVWAWGGISLVLAWIYAKWRSSKATAATATAADTTGSGDSSSETDATAPQFIIENNMPGGGAPSAPVTAPSGPGAPVVTPPTTTPAPPTTIPKTPGPVKVPAPKPVKVPTKKAPIPYKVKTNDNLSSIAAKYHTTAAALWKYNTTAGNRPAATIATLKSRGENKLFAGETILIPQ